MNHNLYEIKGVFNQTKRKRTMHIYAKSESKAKELALQQGFIEPIEIKQIPFNPPTDRQLAYAKDLGIYVSPDSSTEDASALISRKVDFDSDPQPSILEFAENKGLVFSKYIGNKGLFNLIFSKLDNRDLIAFFAFSIYRYLSDDRHANLDTSKHSAIFYKYADDKLSDQSFIKSIRENYQGEDLRFFGKLIVKEGPSDKEFYGGSKNTSAYKKTVNFLQDIFGLENFNETKTISDKGQRKIPQNMTKAKEIVKRETIGSNVNIHDIIPSPERTKAQRQTAAAKQNGGCASLIVLSVAIPVIIKLFS